MISLVAIYYCSVRLTCFEHAAAMVAKSISETWILALRGCCGRTVEVVTQTTCFFRCEGYLIDLI